MCYFPEEVKCWATKSVVFFHFCSLTDSIKKFQLNNHHPGKEQFCGCKQLYDFCMEQLFSGLFLNIPNCLFSNAVFEMGIYSTVGDVLLVLLTINYEGIARKAAID